jgi:hypothetical protein
MSSLPTPNQQPLRNTGQTSAISSISSVQLQPSMRNLMGEKPTVTPFCNSAETKVSALKFLREYGSHLRSETNCGCTQSTSPQTNKEREDAEKPTTGEIASVACMDTQGSLNWNSDSNSNS